MIDLHLHVVPGVDDGAQSLDEACRMCEAAAADGCQALIVTPHQRHVAFDNRDRELLEERLEAVRAAVNGCIDLHLGAEIRVDSELLNELAEHPGGQLVPLADSRYLLLEYPHAGGGPDPEELTHELVIEGWRPIYAHPELVLDWAEDFDLAHRLRGLGACFQLTADSVTGERGRHTKQISAAWIDAGLVDFVASDAHGVDRRPPGLARARRYIERRWSEDMAWRLTTGNAEAVLRDTPFAPAPPPAREEEYV